MKANIRNLKIWVTFFVVFLGVGILSVLNRISGLALLSGLFAGVSLGAVFSILDNI